MIHLLESAILKLIENEIMKLAPVAQEFALKELKMFSDMLIKYIAEKMHIDDKPTIE